MNRYNGTQKAKLSMVLALALAAMIPFAAFAETTTAATTPTTDTTASATSPAQQRNFGGNGHARGNNYSLDTSTLTDEQKTAYDKAVTLYEQIEDAVLLDLVSANVVTQADVDSYTALRTAEKSLSDIDQSVWTAAQYKAYYEAVQKTGDERKTALQALADAGQLTQAQADALSAENQTDLWATISQNSSTNTAIQTALTTLRQAMQTLRSTLREAGISGVANGEQPGGFDNNAQNGMPSQNGFPEQANGQNNSGQQNRTMPNGPQSNQQQGGHI